SDDRRAAAVVPERRIEAQPSGSSAWALAARIARTSGSASNARLSSLAIDPEAIAARGLRYERLDQLLMEHRMGVRGGVHA
ncbi:MAG: hypothetical protein ACKOFI_00305, partial [Phycisphaerales bacterium]